MSVGGTDMGARAGVALLAGLLVVGSLAAGCGGRAAATGAASDQPKVGVLLPTAATAARWENVDGPMLERMLRGEGLDPDVRNAAGDGAALAGVAQQMITDGAKVLVVATPDRPSLAAVVAGAKARGVPTIDYDAHGTSSVADYSLALDYRAIGQLQGRGLIRGVRGTKDAAVVELAASPTESSTEALLDGQHNILRPRYDKRVYRLVGSQRFTAGPTAAGPGSEAGAGPAFEKLLDAAGGKVDGVVAADDQIAAEVIDVLRRREMVGKTVVTGMGATPDALRAILRGEQFMTVYIPPETQTAATARLAAALARGDRAAADQQASISGGTAGDGGSRAVPLTPASVTLDTIKQVFDGGLADSGDVCTDDLALRCNQLSIS